MYIGTGGAAVAENAASAGRWGLMWRALRSRNYRLFFGGQLISLVGTFLTQMATAWLAYRLVRSSPYHREAPIVLGLVGFVGQIPMFAVAPFAGVWVDRWDRRRLLIIT